MHLRSLIAAFAAGALLAGCGSSDDDGGTETATEPPPAGREPDRDEAEPPPVGDGNGGVELKRLGDFDQPVHVAQPPEGDDASYVVEQCGRVIRVEPGGEAEAFLDISDEVSCGGEQGLLSVAFAPDHERSGLQIGRAHV